MAKGLSVARHYLAKLCQMFFLQFVINKLMTPMLVELSDSNLSFELSIKFLTTIVINNLPNTFMYPKIWSGR